MRSDAGTRTADPRWKRGLHFATPWRASYRLDNSVLTTTGALAPAIACDGGPYDDVDNAERSELVERALFNTQTMVAVSDDVLIVTTGGNETLAFERASDIGSSTTVGQWLLRSYSVSEGGPEAELDIEDEDSRVVLNLGDNGRAWLSYSCGGLDGFYTFDDGVLSFSMSDALVDVLCPPLGRRPTRR